MIQITNEDNYNKLLSSGMFWEFYPELTGEWEVDKKVILQKKLEDFYCNQDDGPYNNNPCAEQCKICKNAQEMNETI